MRNTRIAEHMVRYPHTSSPELSLSKAADLLKKHGIRHLPVLENDQLVGIVSERDLKAAMNLDRASALTVRDIMRLDVFFVDQSTPLSDVAEKMAESKMGSAIVVNKLKEVVGIFTTTDALRLLAGRLDDQRMEDFIFDLSEGEYEDAYDARRFSVG